MYTCPRGWVSFIPASDVFLVIWIQLNNPLYRSSWPTGNNMLYEVLKLLHDSFHFAVIDDF
jgi:hypothetical protein